MLKVLMIEPDSFFASICERAFHHEGIDTAHALNGEDVRAQIDKHDPDAVLLAIALPRRSGFEILEELREHQGKKRLPIIVCTHLGTKEDVDRCFSLGASDYLIKSQHSLEDLVQRVKKSILGV